MKIGSIDLTRDVLVIAEIGNNHEGDFGRAREMIAAAAAAGAQAVKFQTILPEHLVAPSQDARLAQLRRYAFTAGQFAELAAEAARHGAMFLSTPFALAAVDMLDPLVPAFKIASGDNNFVPLLEKVAATGKPVIMSTGMADLAAVRAAKTTLERVWADRGAAGGLVLLHCVSSYPTLPADANLSAIRQLAEATGAVVGYSDHTLGIDAAVLSVALGARVIEKHFTLSKTQSEFRDHQLSAEPSELAELVRRVREAQVLLGTGSDSTAPCEEATAAAARRSIVAGRDLPAGHVLTRDDLDWLRPAGGLSPGAEGLIEGRRLRQAVVHGDRILTEMVE